MKDPSFQWTPAYWQGWREAQNPYRQFKSERDRSLALQALHLREGDRVLEVGCGYGWISRALLDSAKIRWVGIDLSESMVRELRASLAEHQPAAIVANAFQLPFPAESFDKVLCSGVLMHLADDSAALKEMVRVLRRDGMLVCSINNALSPFAAPVRLRNRFKKGFIQNFRLPAASRRRLESLGLELREVAGDSLFATVPLQIGWFSFPPARAFSLVRSLDQ